MLVYCKFCIYNWPSGKLELPPSIETSLSNVLLDMGVGHEVAHRRASGLGCAVSRRIGVLSSGRT
jgi:hypothetical protein